MRAPAAVLLAAVLLVGGAEASPTALPQQHGRVDLASQANLELRGAVTGEGLAAAVAGAGDVDGDGVADVLLGAPSAGHRERAGSGSAYVVFGRSTSGAVDLAELGDRGFRIDGATPGDRTGDAVAGAGDVNGDGRPDLLVGAHGADPNGRPNSGSAYVVFGRQTSAPVDLAALGEQGFRIDGAAPGDRAGWSVSAAGDVNGDGLGDLLVGAAFADSNLRQGSGSAYVVFGRQTSAPLDLAALGEQGFRIDGAAPLDFASEAIAAVGDLNGDGKGDVLVGATFADNNGRENSGSAYAVYGKSSGEAVDLGSLGEQGFRIDGAVAGDGAGAALASGDVDGDGRVDLVLGAVFADANGRQGSGSAYVLAAPAGGVVDLAAPAGPLLRIDGAAPLDFAGGSLAVAGNVTGGGRTDVLLGATGAGAGSRENAGAAYVVSVADAGAAIDLAALGGSGFTMEGAAAADAAGESVAATGDVNGDGRADVLVGAASADAGGRRNAGAAYVLYGFGEPELAYAPLSARAGRAIRPHLPRLVRRTGPARFAVTAPLPARLRLDPRSGTVSGTPVTGLPRTAFTVTMLDLAGSIRAPLTVTVVDRKPPRLALRGARVQRVLPRGVVSVLASCDEPCRLRAVGKVVVPERGPPLSLTTARATLDAPGSAMLRLSLSTAARGRLARVLEANGRARAIVSVRAVDRAGNRSASARTIALRA